MNALASVFLKVLERVVHNFVYSSTQHLRQWHQMFAVAKEKHIEADETNEDITKVIKGPKFTYRVSL